MDVVSSLIELSEMLNCSPDEVLALSARLLGILYFCFSAAVGFVIVFFAEFVSVVLKAFRKRRQKKP